MKSKKPTKVADQSLDIVNENLEKLREVFPNMVKEGVVDFDALKTFFDIEGILADNEKYGLSWSGKSNAFRAIKTPSTGTLTPQKKESKYWDDTENVFIEGDNLEVLKLLQKHYREKIKMIYIDPPYNTGKDFVYKDNFTQGVADYYEQTGQTEGGIKMTANTEKNGRYHSDWLTMMYPRLFLAKNLLKEDGVIFVSIDDNEVANLRLIMDEIFGEENFITSLVWQKKTGASDAKNIAIITESILVYSKRIEKSSDQFTRNNKSYDIDRYKFSDKFVSTRGNYYIDNLDRGGLQYSKSLNFPITCPDGTVTYPNGRIEFREEGWIWKWSKKKFDWAIENNFIEFRKSKNKESGWSVCYKNYLNVDNEGNKIERSAPVKNVISDILNANSSADMKELFERAVFPYSKPVDLIKKVVSFYQTNNDTILDFFAGSGTTAHAVMDLNAKDGGDRKWISVQLPEVVDEKSEAAKAGYKHIAEISRERIRRAGEKILKNKKEEIAERNNPLDIGFKSFKLSSSNYRRWNMEGEDLLPEDIIEQSKLFVEQPLVDKYDTESVVYEILLKEGFELNSDLEKVKTKSGIEYFKAVDKTTEKEIYITFAKKLAMKEIGEIGMKKDTTFVCFDLALDDTTKVNIAREVNIKTI